MRSRYTAFAIGDEEHLLRSWHESTRPPDVGLDAMVRWVGLTIVTTERGGPFHDDGIVEFEATCELGGLRSVLRERSRFQRLRGAWCYLVAEPVNE